MTDNPTLADLRVYNPNTDEHGWRKDPMVRPATREDIIAVLGGVEVMVCAAHSSPWYEDEGMCQRAAAGSVYGEADGLWYECSVPGRYLIIPVEES